MQEAAMCIEGQRVRIVQDIELFPTGIFRQGLTGTVELAEDDTADFLCHVKLDETQPELEDWDNRLQVWKSTHWLGMACSAEYFEELEG